MRGVLVRGVEFDSDLLEASGGVLQAVGHGVHRLGDVGLRSEVVDPEPAVVVLVLEPAGELAE